MRTGERDADVPLWWRHVLEASALELFSCAAKVNRRGTLPSLIRDLNEAALELNK